MVLSAAVLMQICLGGIYAWSTFVPPLREQYGLSAAQCQIIFGGTILFITIGTVLGGRVEARYGPRFVALVGAVLYASGYFLASQSHGAFPLLLPSKTLPVWT